MIRFALMLILMILIRFLRGLIEVKGEKADFFSHTSINNLENILNRIYIYMYTCLTWLSGLNPLFFIFF